MSVNAGAVREPVVDEVVRDGQFTIGALGAASRHDRHQVLEISGPGIGHFHPASRLGKASGVDGPQYLGRQIDW